MDKNPQLPTPTEGQPIPAADDPRISRPDNSIREVWTSATQHHFLFLKPGEKHRFEAIVHESGMLFSRLPHRQPNAQLLLRLNQLSRWFPRSLLWIALGLIALVIRRPRGGRPLVALALAALFVIAFNALGLFADPRFALPVAPTFILFGTCALLGQTPMKDPRDRRPVD